jgi:hypothetical protein
MNQYIYLTKENNSSYKVHKSKSYPHYTPSIVLTFTVNNCDQIKPLITKRFKNIFTFDNNSFGGDICEMT